MVLIHYACPIMYMVHQCRKRQVPPGFFILISYVLCEVKSQLVVIKHLKYHYSSFPTMDVYWQESSDMYHVELGDMT